MALTTTFRLTNILFTKTYSLISVGGKWEYQTILISHPAASITSHYTNHDEQGNHLVHSHLYINQFSLNRKNVWDCQKLIQMMSQCDIVTPTALLIIQYVED